MAGKRNRTNTSGAGLAGSDFQEDEETPKSEPTYSTTSGISRAGPALGALVVCIIQVIRRSYDRQTRTRRRIIRKVVTCVVLAATALFGQEETPDHRLRTSAAVLHEIVTAPDSAIPKELL